jgi:hypothetical protein
MIVDVKLVMLFLMPQYSECYMNSYIMATHFMEVKQNLFNGM